MEYTKDMWISLLIQENVCDEKDLVPALTILGAMNVGVNKRKVAKWIGTREKNIEPYWNNLKKYGGFKGGKVVFDLKYSTIELALMIAMAQGYLKKVIK